MEQVPYSANEGSSQTADAQADQGLELSYIKLYVMLSIGSNFYTDNIYCGHATLNLERQLNTIF